jgi:cytoskeleton protein RodZ
MFAIGDSLREARNRRGLSAADVQKGIRIRERYLTALEEEHWDMLPGEAYTKGFLRTYAEFLGLNGNLYIDEYNARIAHRDEDPPLVPESLAAPRRPGSGVLRAVVGILVLGALVAAVVAWRVGGSTKAPARGHASAAAVVAASAHSAAPAAAKPVEKHAAATPATAVATRTAIKATRGRCWLSVRIGGPNGRELFRGILEQGQALHYHLEGNLWLRMGRPLLLDVTVGGRQVQGLPATPGNVLLTPAGAQAA